jgi:hypothetical protein
MMEPTFLERLPPRFRRRFRANMIVLAIIVALFVIPPRCGAYGTVAGYTIVWLALVAFIVTLLRQAQPRPGAPAFILSAALALLLGYPIVAGWIERRLVDPAALSIVAGAVVYLVLIIAYRRVFLPSLFGATRANPIAEFRLVRQAQREARLETRRNIEAIKTQLLNRNSSES